MRRIKTAIILCMMSWILAFIYRTELSAEPGREIKTLSCTIGDRAAELPVRVENGHVWADAEVLASYLGCTAEYGNGVLAITNMDTQKKVLFEMGTTDVFFVAWLCTADYVAPFASMEENDIYWIPLEFSLLVLDSSLFISNNKIIYISMPEENIVNVIKPLTQNAGRYSFDWEREFNYSDTDELVIGTASFFANTLNELLKEPGSYVSHVAAQLLDAPGSYDEEYAKKLSLLLVSESQDELKETSKAVTDIYKYISPKGEFAKSLDSIGTQLDNNVGYWQKACESLLSGMENSNSDTLKYNAAYQQLEKALSEQDIFESTGGFFHSVQKSMTKDISKMLSVANVLAKGAEFLAYADEFNHQDAFAVAALKNFCQVSESDSMISEVMRDTLRRQADSLQSEKFSYMIGGYISDHWQEWCVKLMEKTSGTSFGDILATDAKALQIAWDIASDYIPILKDGLDSTEKFELALYAERIQADAHVAMIDVKDKISGNGKLDERYLYPLAQAYYIYLKACMVTRDAAVASLDSKKYLLGEDVIQEIKEYEDGINQEIAKYLVIMKKAQADKDGKLDNSNMAFGFLPSDNKEYLEKYDDGKLIEFLDNAESIEAEQNDKEQKEVKKVNGKAVQDGRFAEVIETILIPQYGIVSTDRELSRLEGMLFTREEDLNGDNVTELIVGRVTAEKPDNISYPYAYEGEILYRYFLLEVYQMEEDIESFCVADMRAWRAFEWGLDDTLIFSVEGLNFKDRWDCATYTFSNEKYILVDLCNGYDSYTYIYKFEEKLVLQDAICLDDGPSHCLMYIRDTDSAEGWVFNEVESNLDYWKYLPAPYDDMDHDAPEQKEYHLWTEARYIEEIQKYGLSATNVRFYGQIEYSLGYTYDLEDVYYAVSGGICFLGNISEYYEKDESEHYYQFKDFQRSLHSADLPMGTGVLNENWGQVYNDILLQYYNIFTDKSISLQRRSDLDVVNYVLYYERDGNRPCSFSITDIDGNGVPELLIIINHHILDLYTCQDGKVIRLLEQPTERSELHLCEDEILYERGSGGAASTYYQYYKIREDGKSCDLFEYYHVESDAGDEYADVTVEDVSGNKETFSRDEFINRYNAIYPLASVQSETLSLENIEGATGVSEIGQTFLTGKDIVQAPYFRMGLCENYTEVLENYYLRTMEYSEFENLSIVWDFDSWENREVIEVKIKDTETDEIRFIDTMNRRTCNVTEVNQLTGEIKTINLLED